MKGIGDQYDYGMRMYDPRVGRFLSVDPLQKKYPWYTPYQFAGNTPIQAIDLDGREEVHFYVVESNGKLNQVSVTVSGDAEADKVKLNELYFKGQFFWQKGDDPTVFNDAVTGLNTWGPFWELGWNKDMAGKTLNEVADEWKESEAKLARSEAELNEGIKAYWRATPEGQLPGLELGMLSFAEMAAPGQGAAISVESQASQRASSSAHEGIDETPTPDVVGEGSNPGAATQSSTGVSTTSQILGKGPSSDVLGTNLETMGDQRPQNAAAHHIVAGTDPRAAVARGVLAKEGIDINDGVNGVFLPKNSKYSTPPMQTHSTVHTNRYYQEINTRLLNAAPGQVRQELNTIKAELLNGTFPH